MQFAIVIIVIGLFVIVRQRSLLRLGSIQITLGAMDFGRLMVVVGMTLFAVQYLTQLRI